MNYYSSNTRNGQLYTVVSGDTLYSISRQYSVPLAMLLQANPNIDLYNMVEGMELSIPGERPFDGFIHAYQPSPVLVADEITEREVQKEEQQHELRYILPKHPIESRENEIVEAKETSSITVIKYIVKRGDTLGDLYERFGIRYEDIIRYNNLSKIELNPGSIIRVPNRMTMDEPKYEIE